MVYVDACRTVVAATETNREDQIMRNQLSVGERVFLALVACSISYFIVAAIH